jgi:hypothetical protein
VALAIALRTHTSSTELRASATRDMLYRYLAEQVLAGVSPSQREFLLATSIFPAFNVSIAQALGGTFEFIADLRRGVAFLTETSPGQYRYHDLFRDSSKASFCVAGRQCGNARGLPARSCSKKTATRSAPSRFMQERAMHRPSYASWSMPALAFSNGARRTGSRPRCTQCPIRCGASGRQSSAFRRL